MLSKVTTAQSREPLGLTMPKTSPSVLLIRLDGIGDALALAPLLAALRARDIPVDAVLSAQNVDAFAPSALRERWAAPFAQRDSSRANLDAIATFGRELSERGYSHALVATEDPGGYRLARACGAPRRIGFANGWGKPLKTMWVRSLLTQTLYRPAGLDPRAPHECEVLFALGASLLDGDAPSRDPKVVGPLVIDSAVPRDKRIAFQVTDKWDRLGIDFEDVIATARTIERGDLHAFASSRETAYADRFEREIGAPVERFDSLPPWKAAIAAAAALVAPDGGAVHVAGMVGTPVAAVFPEQTDFELQAARWTPWAAPGRVVKASPGWPLAATQALERFAMDRAGSNTA